MTGFQIFLCVLIGIALFFVLVLSIPVRIFISYDDKIRLSIKYLFIKLDILPVGPKKAKKEKVQKKEEKPEKAENDNTPKEKKPNPIIEMVKANGHDGMMTVISNLGKVLGTYGGKLFKSIIFNRLDLNISVGTGDAASLCVALLGQDIIDYCCRLSSLGDLYVGNMLAMFKRGECGEVGLLLLFGIAG